MRFLYLQLKCVICGHKDERPAEQCRRKDNPICPKCYGPMTVTGTSAKYG